MNLAEKNVLVVGTGISGIAACELLLDKKIRVTLFDGNKDLDLEKVYEKSEKLRTVPVILGDLTEEQMDQFDVTVLSPGVPTDIPMVNRMREKGIAIWGEIELAYYFSKGRIAAITGTNGKTTTTALTGEIMKNYYKDVKVVGNIGIPYTSVASDTTDETVTVAEVSSFQLETIHEFKPESFRKTRAALLRALPSRILRTRREQHQPSQRGPPLLHPCGIRACIRLPSRRILEDGFCNLAPCLLHAFHAFRKFLAFCRVHADELERHRAGLSAHRDPDRR